MKTPIGKRFIPFLVAFPGTLILVAGLFAAGKLSPREMGYMLVAGCFTAIVVLTLLLDKATKEAKSVTHQSDARDNSTTRKKLLRSIRTCKVAIAVMSVTFVYAFWATRNSPLLPRIVGAVINIAITTVFVIALKTQKAKLKQ